MIIIDIETTGLDPIRNSIASIGAVDYDTGDEFYIENRVGNINEIDDAALAVNGFTRDQLYGDWAYDNKPFRDVAYVRFLTWCKGRDCLVGGQNVGSFDLRWLKVVHDDATRGAADPVYTHRDQLQDIYPWPFGYRSVDLHAVAYAKLGKSLSLDGILMSVGLQPEPKPHNALTGARLERDAFKRLLS